MSALCLQFWRGGEGGNIRPRLLSCRETGWERTSETGANHRFGKHKALRIAKRNWGTPTSTYSTYFQRYICKMPCYMRIKPTHTESDVRTEYLCVEVCGCVSEFQEIFFCGAGRERERRNGRIRQLDNMYGVLYSVHSTICTASSFSRRGAVLDIICRQKLKRQEKRMEISVSVLSLYEWPHM